MKRIMVLLSIILISGCATLNSNPQYIQSYNQDIENIWLIVKKIPFKNSYTYKIVSSEETLYPNMPEIRGICVFLPKAFIDYVYKYYYDNHSEIFTCLFLHEISHTEFNLATKPVETHFLVDQKAFEYLLSQYFPNNTRYKINEFYSFLKVIQNYNESLKGAGKHCFNILWNTLNAASYLYAGVGSFGDWFAYDISTRVYYFQGQHLQYKPKFVFKRSNFQRTNR